MKNKFIKIIALFIIVATLTSIALPVNVDAKTIAEFESEVANYTAQLQAKKNQIAANNEAVAKIEEKIKGISVQMEEIKTETERLQTEIEESNKKIEQKGEESKHIMQYYQMSEGNNSYLEYIFGAESITDMIYRYSIVEQLTEYNRNIMNELKKLIEENKKKTEQLKEKNKELENLKKELKAEQDKINISTAGIRDSMPSIEEQIKAAKDSVAYYKSLGCKSNEDIQSCIVRVSKASGSSLPSTGTTLRPTQNGNLAGGIGSYWGHLGQDITSPYKKGETIYPIADGEIISVYQDNCYNFCSYVCNGKGNVIVVRHNINNRYIYASYVHMSSMNYSINDYTGINGHPFPIKVSRYTALGKMGNTGCTSGGDEGGTYIHLHLELATCHWKPGGGCSSYSQYTNSILNPRNYVVFPASWSNR